MQEQLSAIPPKKQMIGIPNVPMPPKLRFFQQNNVNYQQMVPNPQIVAAMAANNSQRANNFKGININAFMRARNAMQDPKQSQQMIPIAPFSINPKELNFYPTSRWETSPEVNLNLLISDYFRARSSKKLRFEHKLWNALQITKAYPDLVSIIGVIWVNEKVIKVYRDIFGRLLEITRATAALFNIQGSFSSHGFEQINDDQVDNAANLQELLEDVDNSKIRLYFHKAGLFTQLSTENQVNHCKWQSVEL